VLSLVADKNGRLWAALYFAGETDGWSLGQLDAATGATRFTQVLGGRPSELVLDGQDNVYTHVTGTAFPLSPVGTGPMGSSGPAGSGAMAMEHLVSLSALPAVRFQIALSRADRPRAAFNGELLMQSGELRSTVDGQVRAGPLRFDFETVLSPLMSASARYRWRMIDCCPACDCDDELLGLSLDGFAAGSGTPRFTWGPIDGFVVPHVSEASLLSDGSALFASEVPSTAMVELRAIDAAGAQKFACTIGSASRPYESSTWLGPAALVSGRWVVVQQDHCFTCVHDPAPVLKAYDVTGLSIAAAGWTGLQSSPGRTGAPR